jgi:hypothetical protein
MIQAKIGRQKASGMNTSYSLKSLTFPGINDPNLMSFSLIPCEPRWFHFSADTAALQFCATKFHKRALEQELGMLETEID